MPVSARRLAQIVDPFTNKPTEVHKESAVTLRTPQARVLAALMPDNPHSPEILWQSYTSFNLAKKIGVSPVSETTRRALRGLQEGSRSGNPHKGLLALGYVLQFELDIDGVSETHFQITRAGMEAIRDYLSKKEIPPLRQRDLCINDRYRESGDMSEAQPC